MRKYSYLAVLIIFVQFVFVISTKVSAATNTVTDVNKIKTGILSDINQNDIVNIKASKYINKRDTIKSVIRSVSNSIDANQNDGEILVKFNKSVINLQDVKDASKAKNFAREMKLSIDGLLNISNIMRLKTVDAENIDDIIEVLKNDPRVEVVEKNLRKKLMIMPEEQPDSTQDYISNYRLPTYGLPAVWDVTTGTPEMVIAVIDTGISYGHPDLSNKMWDGSNCKNELNETSQCPNHGWDFFDNDNDPVDESGHGTNMAGIIAAESNNHRGISGINWNAKLMALRVGDDDGLKIDSIINAIDFAINNNVKIINASFGGGSSELERQAFQRFSDAGGLVIASAGNDGTDNDVEPMYPASYDLDNIISVASVGSEHIPTDWSQDMSGVSYFSNYGANSVDIGAPGEYLYTTDFYSAKYTEYFDKPGDGNIPNGWLRNDEDFWYIPSSTINGVVYYGLLIPDKNSFPYLSNTDTYVTSQKIDLGDALSARFSIFLSCDTEYSEYSEYSWTDYLSLEMTSNGVDYYPAQRFDEFVLDNDSSPENNYSGEAINGYSVILSKDYLTSNYAFRFRWVTNDTDNNYAGCKIYNTIIEKADRNSEGYGSSIGTSPAAAYTTGVASLLWGYHPDLTATQVKQSLMDNGVPLESLRGKIASGKIINAFYAFNPDIINAPLIATTSVNNGQIDVPLDSAPSILFSKPINVEKLYNYANVQMIRRHDEYPTMSWDQNFYPIDDNNTRVSIKRYELMSPNTKYFFNLGSEIEDMFGNKLSNEWTSAAKDDHSFITLADENYRVPTGTVAYSVTSTTNQDVVAYFHGENEYLNMMSSSEHVFTENGSFAFVYFTDDHRLGFTVATVNNIDKGVPTITLLGSNMEIYQGTDYIDAGATATDAVDGDLTASIQVVNSVNTSTAGTYTVTYNVSDTAGNLAPTVTRTVVVLPIATASQILVDNTTVSINNPQVLMGDNNITTSTISVPSGVTNGTLNISALTSNSSTSTVATLPTAIAIIATTSIGRVDVAIPAGVMITSASSTWNGVINLPQVQSNSSVTASADSGKTATVSSVIEIGFGDMMVTFDKAVKITLVGQAGKDVGYSRSGVFTKISSTCSANTQASGDALSAGSECKIDSGSDLVIWTKHFTSFVTYTQTTNPVVITPPAPSASPSPSTPIDTTLKAFVVPTGVVLRAEIATGATRNTLNQVQLSLYGGPNAVRMAISNTADFAGASQETYSTSKLWTLSAGTTAKTVYVKFIDASGYFSNVLTINIPAVTTVVATTTLITVPTVTIAPAQQVLGEKITKLDTLIATLKLNQKSAKVIELQNELKKLGYFPKTFKPTNFYGKMTADAVKKYLASKVAPTPVKQVLGTQVTSLDTLIATLKPGQSSAKVKDMQAKLKALGYFNKNFATTNFYGTLTTAAVKRYQASK
ncbi:MAG: S8 family serine peptidase [Candidatus Magasanikbacteria bacterium]